MRVRHLVSSLVLAATASTLAVGGASSAVATETDVAFLALLEQLGVSFGSEEQAIEAGNGICGIVAEGAANGVDPARIRSDLVQSLRGEGLDANGAAALMRGAVTAYCPMYRSVVGA